MSLSLIRHKRIRTTLAKAKETRWVVERLITKAKNAVALEGKNNKKDVHARREVFAFLRDRSVVSTLFGEIAEKVASRPGGYTRVVKLGRRQGDGAEIAVIELVDFNVGQDAGAAKPATKTTQPRKRQPKKKKETSTTEKAAAPSASASTASSASKE